ncbi:MAG TPA: molybdopterin cofactor-binding domain-containing protein, partial [Stellaceae bacterium]|nr:molybdopterin cofactor-binding domain-containing protein [Stellaceae bacterium]
MDGSFEPRVEDYRLLTGAGNFQDDEAPAAAAWGVFVRSPHAFADIHGIDTTAAEAARGVLTVLTAVDLDAAGIGTVSVPVPVPGSPEMVVTHRPSLAGDCVRHVGDCVALVVAETEAEARDAAELVEVDYIARDAVTDLARAAEPGAPRMFSEAPGNVAVDWHPYGAKPEERAELDRIFAAAAHIARVRLLNQRIVMAPMEPRAGIAVYEPESGRYVLHVASQSAFAMRQHVARTMGVSVDKLRVVSRDVGGAFGMRTSGYPEYPAMLLAAKRLGRPVRWRSTRQEGFLTDNQARHDHRGPPRTRRGRQIPRARHRQS